MALSVADDDVPSLPRGVRLHEDRVRGMTVLLAPERALKLDAIGVAILSEVDGTAPFGRIVATLAARYGAPADQVRRDAETFLTGLMARRVLDCARP